MLWHRLYLQKRRLDRLGIRMDMESERLQRSKKPEETIAETDFFEGRYIVNDVNEAIYSKSILILIP